MPFFINFDELKKTKIENLLSVSTKYLVDIKGSIKYNLKPFPILEISEVHVAKNNENSILNKIVLRVSIIDLLKKKYSIKNITFDGGELIIDLNNLNDVYLTKSFNNQKVFFKNLSLKFFSNKKSFNLDQVNSEIFYGENKIKKIIADAFIGEVPFEIILKDNIFNLNSKKIGLNVSLTNLFDFDAESAS